MAEQTTPTIPYVPIELLVLISQVAPWPHPPKNATPEVLKRLQQRWEGDVIRALARRSVPKNEAQAGVGRFTALQRLLAQHSKELTDAGLIQVVRAPAGASAVPDMQIVAIAAQVDLAPGQDLDVVRVIATVRALREQSKVITSN